MSDIVRIIETYCTANDIEFRYGSDNHLNLIEGNIDASKKHLLLFPVERVKVQGKIGVTNLYEYSGKFMLLVASDYALHYFNENGTDPNTSKYTTNIEPLLLTFEALEKYLFCQDLDISLWKNVDAVNVLDANKDGLWCTFKITTT